VASDIASVSKPQAQYPTSPTLGAQCCSTQKPTLQPAKADAKHMVTRNNAGILRGRLAYLRRFKDVGSDIGKGEMGVSDPSVDNIDSSFLMVRQQDLSNRCPK
jgi:hypothetical protein